MNKLTKQQFRSMVVVGVVSLVMIGAGLAAAQGPGPDQGKGMGRGMKSEFGAGRMAARLDLSDDQQTAIKALHENSRKEGTELRKEMMRLRNELRGEMLKDNPSEKAVLSLNDKIGALKTKLQANRLKTRLAVRELLTPEQRDQMLMMGEDGGRRGHGRHGGRSGRDDRGQARHRARESECPQINK